MTGERILIVEDDAILAMHLADILTGYGYRVDTPLATGEEAVEHVEIDPPDIILMDIRLPGEMNGIEATEAIEKTHDIPVVYLTAYSDPELINHAKLTEPYAYLLKPVPDIEVRTTIEMTLYKHRIDKKLRESEKKFHTVADFTYDWELWIGQNGRIIYCSPSCERITGYPPESFIEDPRLLDKIVHPDDQSIMEEHCRTELKTGESSSIDFRIIHRNGSIRWIGQVCQHVKAPDGTLLGKRISNRDATKRKQAEEALRKSEDKFRSVFDWANDAILLHTLSNDKATGHFIEVNLVACEILGYSREELLAMGPPDIVPAELHSQLKGIITKAQTEKKFIFETKLLRKDGSSFPVESNAHLVDYDSEKIWISHIRDITERKQAEKELRDSEERFSQIAESAGEWIWEVNPDGLYTYASPLVEKILGYKPEELVGTMHFYDLFAPEVREDLKKAAMEAFASQESFSGFLNTTLHKNGNRVILETSGVPHYDDTGRFIGYRGADTDVTERYRAEEALRKSEEQYRNLVENISDVIFSIEIDGKITYISTIVEKIYGYTPDEVIGQQFTRFVHPDDLPGVLEGFQRRIKGEYGENIFRIIGKDGSEHYVRTSQTPIIQEGKVIGFNYVMTDFTERRKAEEALMEVNKKLNMLSSVTRHDILNQIMGIRGHLELSKGMTDNPKLQEYIRIESDAVDTIQRQIEFTRYYQDIGVEEPKWHDVGENVDKVAEQLDLRGIALNNSLKGLEIFADPLIEKVFYNLIENSLRHGEHVTAIEFSYSEKDDSLIISYRDDGIGISEEDKKKLFERGFGKHTGLGLFLSREILSITGITIRETGEPGKGVHFEIIVPKGGYRYKS